MTKDDKSLLVTIVAYDHTFDDLERVIGSFYDDPFPFNIKVVVVDNSKTDKLRYFCEGRLVDYLRPESNIGFGAGHNFAILNSKFKPDFCLVLNPDVFINSISICGVVDYMVDNNIVLSSPCLLNEDKSIQGICRLFPTVPLLLKRILFKYIFNIKIEDEYLMDFSSQPLAVPSLHGACFFVNYNAFVKVGGFDEKFFLYLEDIDLCKRLSQVGQIFYIPLFHAIHIHAKGSRRKLKLLFAHIKSFLYYFLKHGFF